jgi:hypothetical protein
MALQKGFIYLSTARDSTEKRQQIVLTCICVTLAQSHQRFDKTRLKQQIAGNDRAAGAAIATHRA